MYAKSRSRNAKWRTDRRCFVEDTTGIKMRAKVWLCSGAPLGLSAGVSIFPRLKPWAKFQGPCRGLGPARVPVATWMPVATARRARRRAGNCVACGGVGRRSDWLT